MPNLFNLDLAKMVTDALAQAGGVISGTLTKTTPGTRTPGSLTGGTNPTTTTHSFQGVIEVREIRREGQVGAKIMSVVAIYGASISPAAVPEVNDTVTIESETRILLELIGRDPSASVYEFTTEKV